jgi:WD40 repeat protein
MLPAVGLAVATTVGGSGSSAADDGGARWPHLATAGDDGAVRVWEVDSHRPLPPLEGHADSIFDTEFSPDDCTVATAGKDGTVRLWDVASQQQIATLPTSGPDQDLYAVTFSHDGRILATASRDGTTRHPTSMGSWTAKYSTSGQSVSLNVKSKTSTSKTVTSRCEHRMSRA